MCVGASVYTCVGVCVYRCVCEFTLTKKRARPVKCATAAARRQFASWPGPHGAHRLDTCGPPAGGNMAEWVWQHCGQQLLAHWATKACPNARVLIESVYKYCSGCFKNKHTSSSSSERGMGRDRRG